MAPGILLLLAACGILAPPLATTTLAGKLAALSKPSLRADLAVTPQNPREYLWGRLKVRIHAVVFLALVALVAVSLHIGLVMDVPPLRTYKPGDMDAQYYTFKYARPTGIGRLVVQFFCQALTCAFVLLHKLRRACEDGRWMPPRPAAAEAVLWAYVGGLLLFALGNALNLSPLRPSEHYLAGAVSAVAVAIIVMGGLAAIVMDEWEQLVAAYLVIEVEPK